MFLLNNIFENILFNAVRHNQNTEVEIQIRITQETKKERKFIKFEFIDNGIGIPDHMKQQILSTEYRNITKDKIPSGLGIGLLLVRKILEIYKGQISVANRAKDDYSKGSNFIILIPEVK